MNEEIDVICTTVGGKTEANELSRNLVELRLAACVQMEQIKSIYRWKDSVEEENEIRLTIKSPHGKAVISYLRSNHVYEVPEILMNKLKVTKEYRDWCLEVTRKD